MATQPLPPFIPSAKGGARKLSVRDEAAVNGILFVLQTGIPWEDLPQSLGYGRGMTCWRRLRDWNAAGVWDGVAAFNDLLDCLFLEFRRKPLGAHDIPSYAQRIGGACLPDQGQSSFRGFEDSDHHVSNFQFARGGHSVAIAPDDAGRQQAVESAIARYVVSADSAPLEMFREDRLPSGRLAFISNVCWLVWIGLVGILATGAWLAFSWRRLAGAAYLLVVAGLLYSV